MISKSSPSGFARACAISLMACAAAAQPTQPPKAPVPAIALMDASETAQWQTWTRHVGWQVIAADGGAEKNIDLRVLSLTQKVEAAIQSGAVDASRVYL